MHSVNVAIAIQAFDELAYIYKQHQSIEENLTENEQYTFYTSACAPICLTMGIAVDKVKQKRRIRNRK